MNQEHNVTLLKHTGSAVLKRPDGGVVTQRTANPLPRAHLRDSSHNSPSVPPIAFQGVIPVTAKAAADNAALGTSVSFLPMFDPRSVKTNHLYSVMAQQKVKTKGVE